MVPATAPCSAVPFAVLRDSWQPDSVPPANSPPSGLGADVFAAAQRRGAAMTYDEIIAYTLDQLARRAGDAPVGG